MRRCSGYASISQPGCWDRNGEELSRFGSAAPDSTSRPTKCKLVGVRIHRCGRDRCFPTCGHHRHREMTAMSKQPGKSEAPDEAPREHPTDLPKPIGDAVPAPDEPGLDRPLPPTTHPEQTTDETGERPDEPTESPPAETSEPLGDAIPAPAEPGLDQPLPAKKPPSR
jgi:hypothetical protein